MKIYKIIIVALCALFMLGCNNVSNNPASRTPTETLKALSEASKKKDVAGVKTLLSKGSLKLLEDASKAQNKSSDELLTQEGGAPFRDLPEIRGESIEGETAIVDVKNIITDQNERIPLVKEDGEWKVALDKYAEDLMKRMNEQMKQTPTNSNVAPSNSNIAPTNSKQTNIKPNANQNSAANNELKSVQNRLKNN